MCEPKTCKIYWPAAKNSSKSWESPGAIHLDFPGNYPYFFRKNAAALDAFRKEWLELLPEKDISDAALRLHVMKILGPPYPKAHVSQEEFLEWRDEDTLAEWVNGEVIMASPGSKAYQDLMFFPGKIIDAYIKHKDLRSTIASVPDEIGLFRPGAGPAVYPQREHASHKENRICVAISNFVVKNPSPLPQRGHVVACAGVRE